jgi:hypothetical protein
MVSKAYLRRCSRFAVRSEGADVPGDAELRRPPSFASLRRGRQGGGYSAFSQ